MENGFLCKAALETQIEISYLPQIHNNVWHLIPIKATFNFRAKGDKE